MELKRGDKFGDRFQLLSKLGEGGMGEVWKARDTELDRDRNNSSRAPSTTWTRRSSFAVPIGRILLAYWEKRGRKMARKSQHDN
jgi:serine/threonine protein kinase